MTQSQSVDNPGPLDGITVVEFGQYIAVPGAAQIMVDQGATVYKVEPPGGEACRRLAGFGPAMFQSYNRGKRMLELDLTQQADRDKALRLIDKADIVLSNSKPGAMDSFGLGPQALLERKPSLVCVTLSGFGESDEMKSRAGLDIAAQAESGLMWVTGPADAEPQRVGCQIIDAATALAIAQAATAALFKSARTGVGADIRANLWDVAIHVQSPNWMDWIMTGREPVRKGNGQPKAAPAADVIEVADGFIVLSAYMPAHWQRLCELIGRTDLLENPVFATALDRAQHREQLHEVLRDAFSNRMRDELAAELTAHGLVVGAIRQYPEVFEARQRNDDGLFITIPEDKQVDGLPDRYLGPAIRWEGVAAVREVPRALGADNDVLD